MKDYNPPVPSPKPNWRRAWWGLAAGVAPAFVLIVQLPMGHVLASAALQRLAILAFFLELSIWPLLAVILSCCRATRTFGLGMLLGVGMVWLTILAICGGSIGRL